MPKILYVIQAWMEGLVVALDGQVGYKDRLT